MGSGTQFDYTELERAALFGQFASAMKIANNQQRPAQRVSEVLDLGIIQDTHDVQMVPKIIQTATGKLYHVTSDVKIRSAADDINALGCPVKWGLAKTPEKIPMIIQPVDCKVRPIPLGKGTTTEEVYSLYPKIVTPAEFFAFGAKFPEEQREAPHLTVWLDVYGRFYCSVLGVGGGERGVRVGPGVPGGEWDGSYRVLVRE